MILKKMILTVVLFAPVWMMGMENNTIVFAQDGTATAETEIQKDTGMVQFMDATQFFFEAYRSYTTAKMSDSLSVQNEGYAAAIREISKACKLEPQNAEYLMLASQIYRSKGGSSYAKDYFSRAERILHERMEAAPDDVHADLDYAIACLAGEGRFSKTYQQQGEQALAKVIRLCEPELKSKQKHGGLVRALGIAYLLKGETEKGEKVLSMAADLGTTSRFYYELYRDTAKNGTWIWPVGKNGAVREFCMYCLLDVSRNYSE